MRNKRQCHFEDFGPFCGEKNVTQFCRAASPGIVGAKFLGNWLLHPVAYYANGLYFTHGPEAGRFAYQTWASLPPHARKAKRKTPEQVAAAYGLSLAEIGPIDSARLLAFVWLIADRPQDAASDWKRERPLMLVLDNYSVHKSETITEALAVLEAADIFLVYLPSYSPELSKIEPVWNDTKQHYLPTRSYQEVADLKRATENALKRKAENLRQRQLETTNLERLAA